MKRVPSGRASTCSTICSADCEPARSVARLSLVRATQLTLAAALGLLGISAPEAM